MLFPYIYLYDTISTVSILFEQIHAPVKGVSLDVTKNIYWVKLINLLISTIQQKTFPFRQK